MIRQEKLPTEHNGAALPQPQEIRVKRKGAKANPSLFAFNPISVCSVYSVGAIPKTNQP